VTLLKGKIMTQRFSRLLVGAVVLTLALSSCSGGGSPGGPDFTAAPEGEVLFSINAHPWADLTQGGTLTVSIGEFTEQKNQFQADGTVDTWTLWDWYNAELIKFKPNGDLNPNPAYFATPPVASTANGSTVVTYTMNPQAKFNDGTPMDIKAFQNTWQTSNGSNPDFHPNSTDGWNKVVSVEQGKDAFEIVVTFDGSWPWWGGIFNTLLHPSCNTPDCFNNAYVGTDLASAHPEWGAGPYKLDTFDANAGTATFVPNDQWWGDAAKLDTVTMVQRETTAGINAFVNGEIDVVRALNVNSYTQVKDVPGTETRIGASTTTNMLQINMKAASLQDPAVRLAIAAGVDRATLAKVRFQGLNYTEPLPGSFTLFDFQEGAQDNYSAVAPAYDQAAAKATLEQAGYTLNSDGLYAKDGKIIEVHYVLFGDDQLNQNLSQAVQQMLRQIGISLIIDQKASSDFSEVISSGDWEINLSGWAQGDPYGAAYTCQTYCSEADPNYSGLNKTGSGTAEVDAMIHAMEKLPTAEEQIAAVNEIEQKIFAQNTLIPLYRAPVMWQAKTGLANIGAGVFASKSGPFADFRENIGLVE
jgi:peptide/nickel transport system substrate-binding protein